MQTETRQILMPNRLELLVSLYMFRHCTVKLIFNFLGTSIASLRLEIAKEDAALAETGADLPHNMTPSQLIRNGLDLEEQQ
jgi:hypothetical protein